MNEIWYIIDAEQGLFIRTLFQSVCQVCTLFRVAARARDYRTFDTRASRVG